MPEAAGCLCLHPMGCATGSRMLVTSRVGHSLTAVRSLAREHGASVREIGPTMLELRGPQLTQLLAAAGSTLSSVEAAEIRAVMVDDRQGEDLLAAVGVAPTLTQLGARSEHADLLSLLDDEVASFFAMYQPIVSLADSSVIAHEALLRAEGPNGTVLPQALFEAASEAGWIDVLDRVGRTTALRGAAGWLGTDQLFVNFIPSSIYRPEVCLRTTEQAANEAGIRLDQVVFEVTESERIIDIDHLDDVFTYYRRLGCKVALDDLGSGYSSLNVLVRLQPDVVKLDKELVQRLPGPGSATVAAVVSMTHAYGGLVLAECVETAEQAAAATDLGVDLAQGWFFGRPQRRP